jgi:phage repressor protein C with HTH and peptisase S24 domain
MAYSVKVHLPNRIATGYAKTVPIVAMTIRTRRPTSPVERFPNRLRDLRKRAGKSQEEVGALAHLSQQTIGKLERGQLRLKADQMDALAQALNVAPEDLVANSPTRSIQVVGRVGAGAEVLPIDDHAKGDGLYEVDCPRGLDPKNTVAVEVTGDSMEPLVQQGWVLFYDRSPEPDPAAVVGKLCVVKLEDGRTMVKQVKRGPERGRFNLLSLNAPMIEDVALEWAGPVKAMLPRDIAAAG